MTQFTYTTSDGTVAPDAETGFLVSININGGSAVSAGAFQIWNAQLEVGPVMTPMEFRPIPMELSLCQRYYQKVANRMILSARTRGSSDTWVVLSCPRPVTMRANPTETGTIVGNADMVQYNGTTDAIQVMVQNSLVSENGIENYIADAEL